METLFFSVRLLVGLCLSGIYIATSLAFPPNYDAEPALFEGPQITESQDFKHTLYEQQSAEENRGGVNTVTVTCYPDSMEIVVKADLFEVGTHIDGNELHLGVENVEFCRAVASSDDEYTISVGLSDCGTKHWITEDSLIYTNLLIYSPMTSPDGVIRMDEAVIPIECHYGRRYSLSSSSLSPTWIPFTSTQAAVELLAFDLRIMTSDGLYKRGSNVFYLGEPIHMEASVRVGHHMGLKVFMSSCVATLDPDRDSVPRYVFLANDGCLVDSQLQGSKSHFLPRTQADKLNLVIDAFRFHKETKGELYITCHLNAVPINDAEPQNKACTFINGRWRSADGNDYLCGYCQSQKEVGQTHSMSSGSGTFGPRSHDKPEAFWRSGMTNKGIYIATSLAFPPNYDAEPALFEGPQITESQDFKHTLYEQQSAEENRGGVNTVTVTCYPDSMEIVVKADLFEVGTHIDGNELHLGVENVDICRAVASSDDAYTISVGLSDCGTKHWITEDSLIYTNLLIYSPMTSPDGVIRMDEAVIPIECHYGRRYSLSSSSLSPTWIPFTSTQAAVELLAFDLRIMTSDGLYKRGSNVFYLGEPIHMEASVRVGHHMGLKVFMSSCVATLDPDRDSVPRYVFLANDGCLVDSQLQGSKSHFLPRTQADKLNLVIDAFRFHEETKGELYITCHLNAVPINDAEPQNKACTFVNGRWRSADGNDYLCGYCQSQKEVGQTHSMSSGSGTFGPRSHDKPEAFWRSGMTNKGGDTVNQDVIPPIPAPATPDMLPPNVDHPSDVDATTLVHVDI
ncbi:uncharacterized protein ACN63O_011730 [Diretmus argenteus]